MTAAGRTHLVQAVVDTMYKFREVRIERDLLASWAGSPRHTISANAIYQAWTEIERVMKAQHKMFAVRPLAALGYRSVATTREELAILQLFDRGGYETTMVRNDLNGKAGLLALLAESQNPTFAVKASLAIAQRQAWLDAQRRAEDPIESLLGAAVTEFTRLPYAVMTTDGPMVQPVGPNGLPDGSPYSLNGRRR